MEVTKRNGLLEAGIFILRAGMGAMFIGHGLPKVIEGPGTWQRLATMVAGNDLPSWILLIMGFLAAGGELFGGILLIVGIATKPVALLMLFIMFGALSSHIKAGQTGFRDLAHAGKAAIAFFSLMLTGGGKYSLDYFIWSRKKNRGNLDKPV